MDDAITRFLDKYIAKTVDYGVQVRARRWYVKRVENFIRAFPDTRLQAISAQELAGYLEGIGRKLDCHDWQFMQIVDTLNKTQDQVFLFAFSFKITNSNTQ